MDLKRVQKHWDRFGKKDALWAALTVPGKEGGHWSVEDFFATGRAEIAAVLRRAPEHGLAIRRRRALDFGCGVGRLTQALAETFELVDGVDIAPSMVAKARELNRHPQTCFFHLSDAPNLALFSAGSFDFIYSTLVLQHMDPASAKGYIAEFCRVLAPGGVAVFQIPSAQAADDPPAGSERTEGRKPIPPDDRRAALYCPDPREPVPAGADLILEVTVANEGATSWPALGGFESAFAVTLGGRWLDESGVPSHHGDARCPLPADLHPGQAASLLLGIEAPRANGEHVLELDMVQEHVAWFADTGSKTCRLRFVVESGIPRSLRRRPLRMRYPRLYQALKASGAAALRGFLARRIGFARMRARQLQDLWRRRTATTPIMEMHCVPLAEIQTAVGAAGGRLVGVDTQVLGGGFRNRVYWVHRPAIEG